MQGSQQAYLLGGAVLAGMPVVVRLSSPQRLKVHSRHTRTETALLQAALLPALARAMFKSGYTYVGLRW
jgi:hypothetical protein